MTDEGPQPQAGTVGNNVARSVLMRASRTVVGVFAATWAGLRDAIWIPAPEVDEDAELARRINERKKLEELSDVGDEVAAAARFVLAEIKDAVQRTREASRTVEGKATNVVTLSVATIGIAAAFRQGQMFRSPLIVLVILLFALTVVVAISVGFPGGTITPDPSAYNMPSTLAGGGAEARMAMKLAEEWARVSGETARLLRTRTLRLKIAFGLLYGTVATTLSFVIYYVLRVAPPR